MILRLPAPLRYGMVAGVCFVLGSVLIPAFAALGLHYAVATILAFAIVTVVGFACHCRWTFQVERSIDGFLRYAGAMLLNLPLTIILIGLAHDGLGWSIAWSAPLASLVLFSWNFLAVRWAVLRTSRGRTVKGSTK